jgi:undecaprenyl-diphosphatase
MVGAEAIAARRPVRDRVTWTGAVAVGVAQVVAGVFPGTSRSAASIFAAMLAGGATRESATEFAFLVGIPTMFAASALELHDALEQGGGEDWTAIAVGFVVSAVVAFAAVKWLLVYIRQHRFTVFAVYRLALGLLLLLA